MQKLTTFLSEASNALEIYKNKIEENLNICLGNVSCDMDSTIGAIILAYYLSYKNKYYDDYGNYDNFWVPVINCPRKELKARLDISYHLKHYGINIDNLVYVDDMDISYYNDAGLLKLAIIDHNKLDITQGWDKSVVVVVDHHVDQGAYMESDRTVEFCGSACSMAINLIFKDNLESILSKDICLFFSAAIFLDTENFKPCLKGTKWGDIDESALMKITRLMNDEYFNILLSKKTDRELNLSLGLDLILKKDYKNYVWGTFVAGISVIFNPMYEILGKFGIDELKSRITEKMAYTKLNFYGIISQVYLSDGSPIRELMFYIENVDQLEKIKVLFEKNFPFSLQKKKFTGLSKLFSFYLIKDGSVSRKKIEPVLKDIFESISNI